MCVRYYSMELRVCVRDTDSCCVCESWSHVCVRYGVVCVCVCECVCARVYDVLYLSVGKPSSVLRVSGCLKIDTHSHLIGLRKFLTHSPLLSSSPPSSPLFSSPSSPL